MPPLRIAHRGGAGLRPENSLTAFADAIARGDDGAELDVQLTRDGQVIVFHDFRLKPDICRDGNGNWLEAPTPRIRDLTLAEIATFDIGRPRPGSAYTRSHPNVEGADAERIPLLMDVVALARQASKTFRLFVELKTSFADPDLSSPPGLLAERTIAVLRDAGYLERTVLVGFDWRALVHAKALEPAVECWFTTLAQSWFRDGDPPPEDDPPVPPALEMLRHWAATGTSPWAAGFDAVRFGGSIRQAIKAAGGDGWFPYYPDAMPAAVAEAQALGLKVGAWTVDKPEDMRGLIAAGIDAICTDRPDVLKAL